MLAQVFGSMSDVQNLMSNLSPEDKAKIADFLVFKLREDGNSERVICDTIRCLLNYKPFYPEKGKSYDGLFISAGYGVRGY